MEQPGTVGHYKRSNFHIIGIEEGEESKENGIDKIFNRIIDENFPKLKKDKSIQIQEAHRTPNGQDQKRNSPRHIIVKMLDTQNKDKILKVTREKQQVTYKGKPIRITTDFSTQTMKARRTRSKAFPVLKDNRCQPRLLYPAKMSIIIEGERKSFHDINKLKEYMSGKPTLQRILEAIQRTEERSNQPQAPRKRNQ